MDHIDMVEKLREKTGLSYEEARAALERADWNLLDALIALEKEGKVHENSARFSTGAAESEPAGTKSAEKGESFGDLVRRFWNWIKRTVRRGNENLLCMEKNGEVTLRMSVTIFVLLLLFAFWVVLPLMVIALFFGYRFSFHGPDLGKESVNRVMGKATDVADDIKSEIRDAADRAQQKDDAKQE